MITLSLLGLYVSRSPREGEGDVMRDVQIEVARPQLLSPADRSSIDGASIDLRWTPVAGAMRYEARILNARGDVVAEASTTEPRAGGLGGPLQRGESYFWSVRARLPDGRVADSEVRTFRVQ